MKFAIPTIAVLLLSTAVPLAAQAQAPQCIRMDQVLDTEVVNNTTILFHMKNGKTWQNTLPQTCVGLYIDNGFEFSPTNPTTNELCSNNGVIHTSKQHNACLLGAFSQK